MRVDKYGGTSMAQPHVVLERLQGSDPVVVVVSAPGKDIERAGTYVSGNGGVKMTDLLLQGDLEAAMLRAKEVAGRAGLAPEQMGDILQQFDDWLERYDDSQAGRVAAGEYFSGLLVAAATGRTMLDPRELVAIRADQTPEVDVSVAALRRVIDTRRRYVLPGFYGHDVTDASRIEVLGRGGSDTTGALAALALRASYYNLSDVDGVYTADPRRDPTARRFDNMSYSRMEALALDGANVLHHEVSAILRGQGCETIVASTFGATGQTRITDS